MQSIYPNAYLKLPKKITRYIKYLVFFWRRHPDLNWGIKVLQTSALPLGYVAGLARVAGFEPAHDGIRIRCLTAWRYPKIYVGWVVGFEPTYTGATTLGLNRLTIPTIPMLVFFTYDCVALSRCGAQVPSYIPLLAPSAPCHKRKILRIHTFVFFTSG